MSESVQLSQHILGMEPYVLVQLTGVDQNDPDAVRVNMEFGGGFDKNTAMDFLKAIVEDSEEV